MAGRLLPDQPTISDVARAAIELIEKGWTDIEPAIDRDGKSTWCYGTEAVAWTLLGAIAGVESNAKIDRLKIQLIGRLKLFIPKGETLVTVNTSRAAALALLAKGVQAAR